MMVSKQLAGVETVYGARSTAVVSVGRNGGPNVRGIKDHVVLRLGGVGVFLPFCGGS